MVFTLHRYIFRELLRVFILAATGLTLILSLGSILRPVQDYGAGPAQVLSLLGYFIPITLTFVLPIAALFAAALVYGRFANDNELDACRASGISLLTLIYPGMSLALLVAIGTLTLSFHVVPAYVRRAEKAIKADAKQILFRNIERKGFYNMPDGKYRIYADAAIEKENSLLGVVAIDARGREVTRVICAESAQVKFESGKRGNQVTVLVHNAHQLDSDGQQTDFEWLPVSGEFPSLLSDNVKFKKIEDIRKIQYDMMKFQPIGKLGRAAYTQLEIEALAEDMIAQMQQGGSKFYQMRNEDVQLEFTAGSCTTGERTIELDGGVKVFEYDPKSEELLSSIEGERGIIQPEDEDDASRLHMVIYGAKWRSRSGAEGLAQRHVLWGLQMPEGIKKSVGEDVLDAIAGIGVVPSRPSAYLTGLRAGVEKKISRTLAEIDAEIHSRLVFGMGCIPLIIIGITLGIIFKGGHLLTAFGLSSIPAAVLIVCIMMGRNITKNPLTTTSPGIALMWAGFIVLCVVGVMLYRRIVRA